MQACCCSSVPRPRLVLGEREHRCGMHVGLRSTLLATVQGITSKCGQIYLASEPHKHDVPSFNAEDKQAAIEHCLKNDKTLYVHCPLSMNLATELGGYHLSTLSKQLNVMRGLQGACVMHIGKTVKTGSISTVTENLNRLTNQKILQPGRSLQARYPLLLEVAAGQGTELGTDWEELRHMYEQLDQTCIGLCLDTQHAFASGLCDFSSHESVVKLFEAADAIAATGISMVHINGSKNPYQSRVDRHAVVADPYEDHIWGRDQESLVSLVDMCSAANIDLISETKDPQRDMLLLQQINQRLESHSK